MSRELHLPKQAEEAAAKKSRQFRRGLCLSDEYDKANLETALAAVLRLPPFFLAEARARDCRREGPLALVDLREQSIWFRPPSLHLSTRSYRARNGGTERSF